MKFKFILYLLILFALSCSKIKDYDSVSKTIIGVWIWTKSVGGFAGITYTPELTGEIIKLSFSSDSIYKAYRNDSLIEEATFKVAETYLEHTGGFSSVLFFNENPRYIYNLTDHNKLILIEMMADGYTDYYKRIE